MLKGKRKVLYIVLFAFSVLKCYVIQRGMNKSFISGRMDVENSISSVIFQILTCYTFYPQFWCFCLLLFKPQSVFYVAVLEELRVFLCHVTCFFFCHSHPHFFLSTDAYAGQPWGAFSSILPIILRGRSVVTAK